MLVRLARLAVALMVFAIPATPALAQAISASVPDSALAYRGIVPGVTLDSLANVTRAFVVNDSACFVSSAATRICQAGQTGRVAFADSGSARLAYMEADTATGRVVTLVLEEPIDDITVAAVRDAFTKRWGTPWSVPSVRPTGGDTVNYLRSTGVGAWVTPTREAVVTLLSPRTPGGAPTLRVMLTDRGLRRLRKERIHAAIERETLRYRGLVAGITLDSLRILTAGLNIDDNSCFSVGAARLCATGWMMLKPDKIRARFLGLRLVRMYDGPEWTVADFTIIVPAEGHTRETARDALEAVWGRASDTKDRDYGDQRANALLAGTRIGAWESTFQKVEASFFSAQRGEPATLSIKLQDKWAVDRWYAARNEPARAQQRAPIAP